VNPRRVAALHRQLAEIHAELAAAYEEPAPANDAAPTQRPRRLPVRVPPKPATEPSEIDKARARDNLARLGYRVK